MNKPSSFRVRFSLLLAVTLVFSMFFSVPLMAEEVEIQQEGWDLTLPSLANAYKDSFLLGNITSPHQLDASTTEMFKHHYNVVTAENHMKPNSLSPAKGVYNFSNADLIIEWAQQNNLKVHGHTLIWHSQSPNWLYRNPDGTPLTRSEARENMQEYISNVAGYFAGKVISWDVVNEAFDGGSLPVTDWKDVLRKNSPWYIAYANGADPALGESGADYIYDAFVFARLADPNAILEYNDYNETDDWKREAMALMAEELNEKWLHDPRNTEPNRKLIESLGMQSHHFTEHPDVTQIEKTIQRFIQAGVKISVSELDVPYGRYNGPTSPTLTYEQQVEQAIYYARLFEYYKAYDAHIHRVTFWGQADSRSWRGSYSPLLFDRSFAAKEAFYAVLDPSHYLEQQGLTPRPLYDLTISIDGDTVISGLAANIAVQVQAADLDNYSAVAYLSKEGIKYSEEFQLAEGSGIISIPHAPEAGNYDVFIDIFDGPTLHASKSLPLTIVENDFELSVNGTTLNYTIDDAYNAVFTLSAEQTSDLLDHHSNTITIDLSDRDFVNGIIFIVPTEPFKNIDKTIQFITKDGVCNVKTKTIWNNSGKKRMITIKGHVATFKNI